MREHLQRYLELLGHVVKSTRNLHLAREALEKGTWDVWIIDVNLPDGNGFDFVEEMKDQHPRCIISISGFDAATNLKRSRELKCVTHLQKPFAAEELTAILQNVTRPPQSSRRK